ncbi:MAG: YkgJ family cysteine cluster protein [Haloarculaceae archaeon]
MEVNCEGCAGCCIDWRPVAPPDVDHDHERRGPYEPLDAVYNLVPLTGDEVRTFLRAGLAGALAPRLWRAPDPADGATVDGVPLAALSGRPVFFVGLRKVPKPVAPFGRPSTWLQTCTFLDPVTLQCRIHGTDRYPEECASYPGRNLALDVETECERVERAGGGERLLDDAPAGRPPRLDRSALGAKVFVHPDPDELDGRIRRLLADEPRPADRATFLAAAAASRPGSAAVDAEKYATARARALDAEAWVDGAIAEWRDRAGAPGTPAPEPSVARGVEDDRGAPGTPGWD